MNDLISRQAAIKAMATWLCNRGDVRTPEKVLSELPDAQQWISVNEKLPDKNGEYLVTIKYGIYGQEKLMIVVKSFFGDQDWNDGFVVAWMPLPEVYHGE